MDEHTLMLDSLELAIIVFAKKSNIKVSRMGGLAALAMKGLDEHTLMFDSHAPKSPNNVMYHCFCLKVQYSGR